MLDDLRRFCLDRRVRGHVCFTGGNPFLYPGFGELYRAAAERGFPTSILGNPVPRAALEKLLAIQRPQYYQVSLEGLPEYNDRIRGAGHFARTIEFLGVLRDLEIESTVMLTLTRDNLEPGAAAGRTAPRPRGALHVQPPLAGRRRRRAAAALARGLRGLSRSVPRGRRKQPDPEL